MYLQVEVLHWLEKTDNIALVLVTGGCVWLSLLYKKERAANGKLTENLTALSTQTATVMTSMSKTIEHFATEQSKAENRIIDKVDECFDRLREGVNTVKDIIAHSEFSTRDEKGTKKTT